MTNPIHGHSPHPEGTMFGYDNETQKYVVVAIDANGKIGKTYQEITLIVGNYIYEAKAEIGSLTSDAVWQACRTDTTGPIVMQWADGNANFDNTADNLAGLNYP